MHHIHRMQLITHMVAVVGIALIMVGIGRYRADFRWVSHGICLDWVDIVPVAGAGVGQIDGSFNR